MKIKHAIEYLLEFMKQSFKKTFITLRCTKIVLLQMHSLGMLTMQENSFILCLTVAIWATWVGPSHPRASLIVFRAIYLLPVRSHETVIQLPACCTSLSLIACSCVGRGGRGIGMAGG